jgi:hypothetical protein
MPRVRLVNASEGSGFGSCKPLCALVGRLSERMGSGPKRRLALGDLRCWGELPAGSG